ncbi:MAG: Cna B-type domain-containing protein, partial [Eubacteriales bacterium]|nr:Cna B-type domain-containing protein [Eubacteriales bacterium]
MQYNENSKHNKNHAEKGIGLVMRSRILRALIVMSCVAPMAAAPVLQPIAAYAEEADAQSAEEAEGGNAEETESGNTEEAAEKTGDAGNAQQTDAPAALTQVSGQVVFAGTTTFPEKVIVHLLANGTIVSSVEVSAQTGWTFTFQNLAVKDENQKDILYTVDEEVPAGFVKTVSGTTITNTWSEQDKAVEDADAAKKAEEEKAAEEAAKKAEEEKAAEKTAK